MAKIFYVIAALVGAAGIVLYFRAANDVRATEWHYFLAFGSLAAGVLWAGLGRVIQLLERIAAKA